MRKNTIAVIGLGQLGSRHMQSMADLSSEHYQIFTVEPQQAAREKAIAQYYAQNQQGSPQVIEVDNICQLPAQLDIVIIATTANVRLAVLKELLHYCCVEFLVLEKVLFQQVEDYYEAETLVRQKGVNAFVNCPRRLITPFNQLQQWFSTESTTVRINGTAWGLCCNMIHMLDFVAGFIGKQPVSIETSLLKPHIYQAKRAGYIEFYGKVHVSFPDNNELLMDCEPGEDLQLVTEVENKNYHLVLDITGQNYSVLDKQANATEIYAFNLMYQSQLTKLVIEEWIGKRQCRLTPFSESIALHVKMIEALLHFYNKHSELSPAKILPIT